MFIIVISHNFCLAVSYIVQVIIIIIYISKCFLDIKEKINLTNEYENIYKYIPPIDPQLKGMHECQFYHTCCQSGRKLHLRSNDSIMLEFPNGKFLRSFRNRSFTVATLE